MNIKEKIVKANKWKWGFGLLMTILLLLIIFKKPIAEHKVTRAKMEMMKRMLKNEPNQWDDDFKQVFDSMILEKKDTLTKTQ